MQSASTAIASMVGAGMWCAEGPPYLRVLRDKLASLRRLQALEHLECVRVVVTAAANVELLLRLYEPQGGELRDVCEPVRVIVFDQRYVASCNFTEGLTYHRLLDSKLRQLRTNNEAYAKQLYNEQADLRGLSRRARVVGRHLCRHARAAGTRQHGHPLSLPSAREPGQRRLPRVDAGPHEQAPAPLPPGGTQVRLDPPHSLPRRRPGVLVGACLAADH